MREKAKKPRFILGEFFPEGLPATKNDPPTMDLTCYDGTKLTIPDDDHAIHDLGKVPGTTWTEIYVDSSKLSREARRKYVTFRPPLRKRLVVRFKQLWREFWS